MKNRILRINRVALLGYLFLLWLCLPGFSGGFLIYTQDPEALGKGTAFIGQADSPSAIFYNPAGISQLEGFNVSQNNIFIIPQTTFKSHITSKNSDTEDKTHFLPNLFVTQRLNDRWAIGLGIFSPFGLSMEWPDGWEGSYLTTFAEIKTVFFNPVISYKVSPDLSLALGYDHVISDITFKKWIPLPSPFPPGKVRFKPQGENDSFNLGILYKPIPFLRLGLSYRHEVAIRYRGNIRFDVNPLLEAVFPDGKASTRITLPPIVGFGIAYNPHPQWNAVFDVVWTGWSTYESIETKFDQRTPPNIVDPKDWKDVFAYHMGIEYEIKKGIFLRGGYSYDISPIPDKTLDPLLPDATIQAPSIGIGYKNGNLSLDCAYVALFYKKRATDKHIYGFNGEYNTFSSLVSFGFRYNF